MAQSAKGVFVDTKTNKVVEEQPAEGVQLVAPGGEVGPDERQAIAVARGDDQAVSIVGEPTPHPTGVYVDTQTGTVTADKPAEGVQLLAQGGQLTPDVKAAIAAHGGDPAEFDPDKPDDVPTEPEAPAEEPDEEPAPEEKPAE